MVSWVLLLHGWAVTEEMIKQYIETQDNGDQTVKV